MACDFNSFSSPKTGTESRLSQLLFERLNNNKLEVSSIYGTATDNKFIEWFKANDGFDYDVDNIDGRRVSTLIKKVKEYQSKVQFRVGKERNVASNRSTVFPTIDMENHAINVLVDKYLAAEDFIKAKGLTNSKDTIKKVLISTLNAHRNKSNLTKNQKEFVLKMMNSIMNEDAIFQAVLHSPKTIQLSKELNVFDQDYVAVNEDEVISNEHTDNDEGYSKDWADSIGENRTTDKTISRQVRRIFELTKKVDSIEKVDGKNVYDYSNNTYSGIAETINFNDYFRSIMNNANFDNVDAFVQSLHEIARTIPDRMALEEIADRCETDLNLRNLLYVNFNQPIIKRNEYAVNEEGGEVRSANPNASPELVLRNKMLASVNNSLSINISGIPNWLKAIKFNIDKSNFDKPIKVAANVEFKNVVDAITEIYKYFDLGINEAGIRNYLAKAEGTNEQKINFIYNNLNNIVSNMLEAISANNNNNDKYNELGKKWFRDRNAAIEAGQPIPERYMSEQGELETVIKDKFISLIVSTAETFAPYQDIKTEFNSKNIEGELVGDTIKQSYLTRFFSRMKNRISAEQFFRTKTKFQQYELSNILYEVTDNNGNVIIPGMLRFNGKDYELTPYYKFLDLELFNGAKDTTLNTNAPYASMSKADFDITAIGEFQNVGYGNTQRLGDNTNKTFNVAKYFIQTPSDAPKTFVISSYKLGIKDLINKDNSINRSHPIYNALNRILQQEIIDMRQAFETIFEFDETGAIVYEDTTSKDWGKQLKPKFKTNIKDLYKQYHYNGEIIKNGKLTGNVFEFWNLLIDHNNHSDVNANINNAIDKSVEGMRDFLYGGATDEVLNNYLDNYIRVKTDEAVKYFSQYKENIDNYSDDLARELALNYTIQYDNFAKMFSGNPKFYKDTRDTIKRNKEVQGSGISYAAFGIDNFDIMDDKVLGRINVGPKTIEVSKAFRYVTVKNTVKPSSELEGIVKRMKEGNVPDNIIEFITGKYSSLSKVNDAQSYITLDEFVRRIWLSGEYNNYKDTIEALYDESKPIDYDKLGKLIQVQKNFYYDLQVDANLNLEVPTQIKNAEYVLIPRFLGDSELSVLNKTMLDNGIGQVNTVETEKAGQTKMLTFWNDEGLLTTSNYDKFIDDIKTSTKIGFYSSLYKQQDTPQHMKAKNKAGVQIVKKMLDNLKGDRGEYYRNKFFKLFTANIQDSYENLVDELGVEVDKSGNVVINPDTGRPNINYDKFYELIKDEFNRLGVDSNMMEYATLNEAGVPNMPNYMPTVRRKIMSVFQSVFTNNVTVQKLPGFHAAQVTNVGFEKAYGQSRYEAETGDIHRKLRYHPDGKDYMEVLLPKWSNALDSLKDKDGNVIKEFTIEDLQAAGLDMMIGYRIPTEGKQSVVKMKVVGFLDESQGSTIIVPDDFVAQTGSDFDIDSVYGIYHEFKRVGNNLVKIKYTDSEEDLLYRYKNYIDENITKAIRKKYDLRTSDEDVERLKQEYSAFIDAQNKESEVLLTNQVKDLIKAENEIYKNSSDRVKKAIKSVDNAIKEKDIEISYKEKIDLYIDILDSIKNDKNVDNTGLQELLDIYNKIKAVQELQSDFSAAKREQYRKNVGAEIAALFEANYKKALENRAKELGLESLKEFANKPIEFQNSRAARNNGILDTFLDIMRLPDTSEENFMSSNFDDIVVAKRKIYDILGLSKEWIDINSFIGQSNYRNQVMSGATLKAISVKRDGFCSISNVAKTTVNSGKAIKVIYSGITPVEGMAQLKATYGDNNVIDLGNGKVEVVHDKLGWSLNDNRNIEGKLLTVYSSETTALILDGVKEGGIINVNTYTFDVFKTFIDLGIDYETAIAFIAQPGVTEIVKQNDSVNSIYNNSRFNPIGAALKSKLVEYIKANVKPDVNEYTKLKDLLVMADIKDSDYKDYSIDKEGLKKSLVPSSNAKENLINDLRVIDQFRRYKALADKVGQHANVMNTDKFGAGQSIYDANKLLNNIEGLKNSKTNWLYSSVNNQPLINAIYPNSDNVMDSVYPSLNAQLKYSTKGSINITKNMFVTENEQFTALKNMLPNAADEKTVYAFENYVIAKAMNTTDFINSNILVDKNDNITNNVTSTDITGLENRRRISGYRQKIVTDFDFNDYSSENVDKFMMLSPANKILLLKNKVDGDSILDYLIPELLDSRKASKGLQSGHRIVVKDNSTSVEQLYELFRDMYYNNNPFFKTAAQDLVRYAVVVEGLNYNYNFVSKIIPAEVLYNDYSKQGTNIVNHTNEYLNTNLIANSDNIVDGFFRQYQDSNIITKFVNKYNPKTKRPAIIFDRFGSDIAVIDNTTAEEVGLIRKTDAVDSNGEAIVNYARYIKTNKYVKGVKNPKLNLYKVTYNEDAVYIYPVNSLERNEIGEVSVNSDNNKYAQSDVYEGLIEQNNFGEIVLPNNLNALERARMNVGRNYTKVINTGEASQSLLNKYATIATSYVISNTNNNPTESDRVVFANIGKLTENVFNGIDKAIINRSKIMFYDNNNAIRVINYLEDKGYTNYQVIGYNSNSAAGTKINELNRKDAIAERERIASEYKAAMIKLNTDNGAYRQFYTQMQGFSGTFGLINRVDSQGINYATMTSQMASTLGLTEGLSATMNVNGNEYLITNIGYVTNVSYKLLSDYKRSADNAKLLDEVVKPALAKEKFHYTNLVRIERYDDAVNNEVENRIMESSLEEVDTKINEFITDQVQSINTTLRFSDSNIAKEVKKQFRLLNIDRNNKVSLNDSLRSTALATTALFIEQHTNHLMNKFNNFYKDLKGNVYSINNPKLYDILIDNDELQNAFSKLLLDVSTFLNDNESISRLEEYDNNTIKNAPIEERRALIDANRSIATIKELYNAVGSIRNKANAARDMFFDKVIGKLSTNPIIQSELNSIITPYKDESTFQLWFTDAQESNVSLIQVVLKKVMNHLRTAELNAVDKVNDFNNKLNAIKEKAPELSINDIIDEKGRLIQQYSDKLLEDMMTLREKAQEAKYEFGPLSQEYHMAKREYDTFLTENIDREYRYDYYKDALDADKILDEFPNVRRKIKEIRLKQSEILSNLINNDYSTLSDNEIKELKKLASQLNALRRTVDYTTGMPADNYEEAIAADRYLTALDAFKKFYFETTEKEGFRKKLNEHLKTISTLEATLSEDELENSVDYVRATKWIEANTYRKVSEDLQKEVNDAFAALKTISPFNKTFRKLAEGKYDNDGVINGNLFTDAEVDLIRKQMLAGYKSETTSEGVEKLIRSKIGNDTNVYKRAFYNGIRNTKKDKQYFDLVRQANEVLIKYYDPVNQRIKTADMSIEDMQKLNRIYDDIQAVTYGYNKENKTIEDIERAKFIHYNVEFLYDNAEYNYQYELAKAKGAEYEKAWLELNFKYNPNEDTVTPNSFLYGYMKPDEKWIDVEKTNARKVIADNIEFKPTKYYWRKLREELAKAPAEVNEWYKANHVFNPNTQRYEPIRIWQTMEYKDKSKISREPKSKWLETKVKAEFRNPKYEEGKISVHTGNYDYINPKYDSVVKADTPMAELYDLVNDTLNELVHDKRSKSFINKGYIPAEAIKQTKEGWQDYRDSILRSLGIYDTPMKSEIEEQFGKRNVNMPMLYRLQQTPLLKVRLQGDNETDAEYAEYLKDVHAKNAEIRKQNDEAHVKASNQNYDEVFSKFIKEAMKFNSIQESSLLMRLTLEELEAMKFYKRNSKGEIMYDNAKSFITGRQEAAKVNTNNAAEHFKSQMKKLIYNEFELDEGKWSKFSRAARAITSAKFMMLNLTGGVSNILTGESQILMETFAKEFLGNSDYQFGVNEYRKHITAYFANAESEKSTDLVDAIIKRIDVLNLDSQTDIGGGEESSLARKAMNYAYFQQSAGEHFMQNSTLLGMMNSHRILKDEKGRGKAITFEQYSRYIRGEALSKILKDYDSAANTNLSERFDEFVNSLKEPGNESEKQKYVYFSKDVVTEFLKVVPNEVRKNFIKEVKDRTKTAKAEFESLETLYSQMELKDGIAQLKEGSGLTNKDIAAFRNKVISVNHKIHGIYDKIGAAKAQGTWWGGIAFQFHKHMIPGWAKRYGYIFGKGIYNEAREAVDKGSYISTWEFLATPFRKRSSLMNDPEIEAIEGWRKFGKNIIEFASNAKVYYNILPEYDKANIRRTAAEICGVMGSVLLFIGARLMWDEKEKDTQLADYLMYWGDRLASEGQQYTPIGAIQEGKKLYANPVAAFANIKDAMTAFEAVTQYMFTGDENKLVYTSGINRGKNRLTYMLQKQIPIYNQYLKHERLGKNNNYYKTGNNIIGYLPLRDWIDSLK